MAIFMCGASSSFDARSSARECAVKAKSGASQRRGTGGLQEFTDVVADITVAEDGVAGDKKVGSGAHDVGYRGQIDAAVHFNAICEAARLTNARECFDFAQRAFDEVLPAEAGVH